MEHVKKALQLKVCAVFFTFSLWTFHFVLSADFRDAQNCSNTNTPTKVQFTGRDLTIIFKKHSR